MHEQVVVGIVDAGNDQATTYFNATSARTCERRNLLIGAYRENAGVPDGDRFSESLHTNGGEDTPVS